MNTKSNLISIIIAVLLLVIVILSICGGITSGIHRTDPLNVETTVDSITTILVVEDTEYPTELITTYSADTDTKSTEEHTVFITQESTVLTATSDTTFNEYDIDEDDALMLAKLMYSEAGVVKSTTERACVAWTVLNRVDQKGTDIKTEITRPHQFAWHEDAKVLSELLDLAYDILARWYYEKETGESNGRVLPSNYYYFYGDGRHNHFFATWDERKARVNEWDYSLSSPYEN